MSVSHPFKHDNVNTLFIDCEAVKANLPGNYKHAGAGAGGSEGAGAGAHTCGTNTSRVCITKAISTN